MPPGGGLRRRPQTPRKRHRAGPQEVRQDPRKLSRLPGSDHRPQRRHRTHRHPAPLARHHGRRGCQGRQGHLVREADDAHHRRGQARGGGRPAERTHLPPEHLVPLQGHLLRTGHDGRTAQETRRQRPAGMAPQGNHLRSHGIHLEILLGGAGEPQAPIRPGRAGLRHVARPGTLQTLQQTPRARHVPRLLGLRRRRTHGYTWTPCSTCWARTTPRP